MHYRQLVLEVIYLVVLKTGLTFGQSMIFNIKSPNCGNIYSNIVLKSSISLQPYGLKMQNKSSFVFDLKANSDASIFATDTPNSKTANNTYRIVIGSYGNRKIELQERRNGEWTGHIMIDGSYLNAAVFQPFWFSWANGKIQAGQGEIVGQNTLMAFIDPNPIIVQGIGISTCWGSTGDWKIKVKVEDEFTGQFSKCLRSNTRSELPVIANYSAPKMTCAGTCATMVTCFGFNYEETNKRCELLSYGDEPVTTIMRRDLVGWDFYTKCYDGKTVCVGCLF